MNGGAKEAVGRNQRQMMRIPVRDGAKLSRRGSDWVVRVSGREAIQGVPVFLLETNRPGRAHERHIQPELAGSDTSGPGIPPNRLYPRAFAPLLVSHYPAEKMQCHGPRGQDGAMIDPKSTKRDETYLTTEKQGCTRAELGTNLVGGIHRMLMSSDGCWMRALQDVSPEDNS
jgi:hypothetical protein